MADEIDPIIEALTQARLNLNTAVTGMTTGAGASRLSEAQLGRLKALSDQNTGCQNSGCGGAEAALASKLGTQNK